MIYVCGTFDNIFLIIILVAQCTINIIFSVALNSDIIYIYIYIYIYIDIYIIYI